jgi:starch phosphorylase
VLELGSEAPDGSADVFNMARMGLRLAQRSNGVSQLHGHVSRRMFAPLWPGIEPADVPIVSITNGVHAPTWTDRRMVELAEKRFGSRDTCSVDWRSDALSDAALWRVRRRMRSRLVSDARRRLTAAWQSENGTSVAPAWLSRVLDPDTLTIGFARRVPTYKRLTLMLRDRDRLKRLLLDPDRPVQLVVAGKSHPADDGGKQLIQELVRFASEPEVRGHIVFLPDYDIGMAQTLYPGCDVWLNTPLRPLEACGTSGMKAALNGSLNLSILDGWWDEYYDGENGWAIPSADAAPDGAERDRIESDALYDLIENEIAPRFYHRDDQDVPREWMRQVRHTLATLSPQLSADRMVRQYVELLYLPAGRTAGELQADDGAAARAFAAWRRWVLDAWAGVRVESVGLGGSRVAVPAGTELRVEARVRLGGLDVDDVEVQLMSGTARENGDLDVAQTIRMKAGGLDSSGAAIFSAPLRPTGAGELGYTVRVLPDSDLLASPTELGLVTYP